MAKSLQDIKNGFLEKLIYEHQLLVKTFIEEGVNALEKAFELDK